MLLFGVNKGTDKVILDYGFVSYFFMKSYAVVLFIITLLTKF